MSTLAPQVSAFVMACEALHWRLLEGHSLTVEEQTLIEQAAIQLMLRAEARRDAPDRDQLPSRDKGWTRWDKQVDREPHP
jgi:hypothetical protein